MLKLVIITGPNKGRQVRVADAEALTIGRDRGRLRLHDSRCSKRHAEITYVSGLWVLRDAGSSNGTYLNKQKLSGLAELERGDIIQCGRIAMRVRQADAQGMPDDAGPAVGFADSTAMDAPSIEDDFLSPSSPTTSSVGSVDDADIAPPAQTDADRAGDANTPSDEIDLDALFDEADRADADDAEDDEDDTPVAPPPQTLDAFDATIELETKPAPAQSQQPAPAPTEADTDTADLDDADQDDAHAGDLLIESGVFDPVPGTAGWGGDSSEQAEGLYESAVTNDDREEAEPAQSPASRVDRGDTADPAPVSPEAAASPAAPTDDAIAGEDEAEAESPAEALSEDAAQREGAADEDDGPAPGDLSDQIKIDDELTDEGKMPGTTQVLPSETLAAAAGCDRSAALANQSDAYDAEAARAPEDDEEDESIGLAEDAPPASVFDLAEAEDAHPPAPPADEAIDTHDDLIRIGDDEPIERPPSEPRSDSKAKLAVAPETDALPMPHDPAPGPADAARTGDSTVAIHGPSETPSPQPAPPQEDTAAPTAGDEQALDEQPADHNEPTDDAPREGATSPATQAEAPPVSATPPPTVPLAQADSEIEDHGGEASQEAAETQAEVETQPEADGLGALRAALAQLDDEPIEDTSPLDDTQPTAPESTDAIAADASDDAPGLDEDELDQAFDLDDDASEAEIAAALDESQAPPTRADDESSHSPQTTDNTSVNEAAPTPPLPDDDADLERIDDIDTAAQAELDPSETDYDAPLPASFGPNAGSASAVGRELDADHAMEHASLVGDAALTLAPDDPAKTVEDEFDHADAPPADDPRSAQPAQGLNPTTTLPPVEPKRSYRSAGPPPKHGLTLKRVGVAAAILAVLALGVALYTGVIDPDNITGKTTRPAPTDSPNEQPDTTTPTAPGPDAVTNRNTPAPPSDPRTNTPGNTPPAQPDRDTPAVDQPPANHYLAGIARTPDPFDNTPRVLGQDALAGRTTDDRSVNRPGTPPPDDNIFTPGPRPLPPILLPEPGGSTNPPNPIDPGNTNPGPANNPQTLNDNDTPPTPTDTTDLDPTAPIDGDRLVFLVDCSGSLVDSLPQMLVWLHEAIATLQPGETFTIVFFQKDQAIEPSPAGLKPLTRDYLADLDREWLNPNASPILPAGRSDPAAAFELALSYNPSDIYLLSDESFAQRAGDTTPEQAVAFVTETLGDTDVRLHGVQFFYDAGDSTLQTLSEQFDGSYEFVAETRHPDRDPIDLLEELENRNP